MVLCLVAFPPVQLVPVRSIVGFCTDVHSQEVNIQLKGGSGHGSYTHLRSQWPIVVDLSLNKISFQEGYTVALGSWTLEFRDNSALDTRIFENSRDISLPVVIHMRKLTAIRLLKGIYYHLLILLRSLKHFSTDVRKLRAVIQNTSAQAPEIKCVGALCGREDYPISEPRGAYVFKNEREEVGVSNR